MVKRSAKVSAAGASGTLPVFAVIMAGGSSTRFWPLARRDRPKQLLHLYGRGTLLQQTARRLRRLVPWSRILVVTTARYADQVRQQLPRLPIDQVVSEPSGRGTASCLTLAAEWLQKRAGDAVMIASPADHVVTDAEAFRRSLLTAVEGARCGHELVTVGIPPARPETGYGYIQVGDKLPGSSLRLVLRFREKPSLALARRLVRRRDYLWNSGIFVWRVSDFLLAVHRELPDTAARLADIWRSLPEAERRIRAAYRRLDSVSVDVGVLEPASRRRRQVPRLTVVRAGFDWNDVGTWDAVAGLWGVDASGNVSVGKTLPIEASGCVIHAPRHVVVALGVKDLVIVESDRALLVCPRSRAQDVRRIIPELQRRRLRHLI